MTVILKALRGQRKIDHGDVDIGEHGHHSRADGEAQRPQHIDDPDAQVVVVQILL